MRIAITGATGLVGGKLTRRLVDRGDEVVALTRDPERAAGVLPEGAHAAAWTPDNPDALAESLSGTDAVVGLAGEPVLGRRWNKKVKEEIRASRVEGTRVLVAAMEAAEDGPRALVNASAVGYYGPRGSEEIAEDAPPGNDYLAEVCVAWEGAAREAENFGARVVLLRIGIVLSQDGGALPRMLPPFRFFVGGRIGNGRQGFPWIHVDDLVGMMLFALDNDDLAGPINGTAPHPVSNGEFSKALGKALGRPSWLPVPRPVLRIVMGPAAKILAAGQMPVPRRMLEAGYEFKYPQLDAALAACRRKASK